MVHFALLCAEYLAQCFARKSCNKTIARQLMIAYPTPVSLCGIAVLIILTSVVYMVELWSSGREHLTVSLALELMPQYKSPAAMLLYFSYTTYQIQH